MPTTDDKTSETPHTSIRLALLRFLLPIVGRIFRRPPTSAAKAAAAAADVARQDAVALEPAADRFSQISYVAEPLRSAEADPLSAALDYLRTHAAELDIEVATLAGTHQQLSFSEPREQGEQFRLGQQKQLLNSSTIIFNQTYLNVPVWRAAITITLKHQPLQVVMVTSTIERGVAASLPSAERIEEHRTVFALAAVQEKLSALGLEDKSATVGAIAEDDRPATADFLRGVLGRNMGEAPADDDLEAIRGRFFIYRYRAEDRLPGEAEVRAAPESEPESPSKDPAAQTDRPLPMLELPPVASSVREGDWRLVSEITFRLSTPQYGEINWRALIDVETNSVLLLEPLVSGLNGLVFVRDPITSTGDSGLGPDRKNAALNPHRSSVVLENLDPPVNRLQSLRGRFAVVTDVNAPNIAPPTESAGRDFSYDVRTNNFAAVNAYYHTNAFFALVESLGFPVQTYFRHTRFPVRVDHRDFVGESVDTINAWCVGNGTSGIQYAGYALNDLGDRTNPIGRACNSRVHFHELGGHGILYEHVGSANFGFAHSAGDSISAIYHDPESRHTEDRFRYAPWNPSNDRRFDRDVAQGWAWGGIKDLRGPSRAQLGYQREQILCTTLFNLYRSIGGNSPDPAQKRAASRTAIYLILRAVSTLTPATNPTNAEGFANALMAADLFDWSSERLAGGAYSKVIRWVFERQGLYQPSGALGPVTRPGAPPATDVYIDDGRGGEYSYQTAYWNNPSIWNRLRADGVATHQDARAGTTNFAYVTVANRGTVAAGGVRVRAYRRKLGGGTQWPHDFEPLQPAEILIGTIAPNRSETKIAGPFSWVPNAEASRQNSLLMVASADGDPSNIVHFTSGETIDETRLVPHDNNIGLRRMTVIAQPPPPISGDVSTWTLVRALGSRFRFWG